jgi:hypothetical protein
VEQTEGQRREQDALRELEGTDRDEGGRLALPHILGSTSKDTTAPTTIDPATARCHVLAEKSEPGGGLPHHVV